MVKIARTLCLLSAATIAANPDIGSAQEAHPLVTSNQVYLCDQQGGNSYVLPNSLYSEILKLADFPPVILEEAFNSGMTLEDIVKSNEFPDENSYDEKLRENIGKIRKKKSAIKGATSGSLATSDQPNSFLQRSGYVLRSVQETPEKYRIDGLFGEKRPAVGIECIEPVEESRIVKGINEFLDKNLDNLRLRESLIDLALSNEPPESLTGKKKIDALKDVKFAKLSYARDSEKNTKNTSAQGVLAYRISEFSPFISYEFLERREPGDENDKDIEVISPGVQYNSLFSSFGYPAHLRGNIFTAFDLENNAERVAVNTTIEPGFSIGENLISLGSYTAPFDGPFWIRPSLRALFEVSHVLEAGSNEDFQSADDFFGIGIETGLKIKVPGIPIIDSATLGVDYKVLQLIAGDDSTYDLFDVSLNWSPKDVPYFGIEASYEEGQNSFTFQDQETFSLSIGVRF